MTISDAFIENGAGRSNVAPSDVWVGGGGTPDLLTSSEKIPRIIHYCWFGGKPLSEMGKRCLASWKKYCPDYRIIEWNESNFDIHYNAYVSEAYGNQKWAFVSDVARLYALVNFGGIYMDTDVEVIRPLDSLLQYEAVAGFETDTNVATGFMGCVKNHPLFLDFLRAYDGVHFQRSDGSLNIETNVTRITKICERHGLNKNGTLQAVDGLVVLPKDYLSPKDFETGKLRITENTLAIHHYEASWQSEERRYAAKVQAFLMNKLRLPSHPAGYVATFIAAAKFHGFPAACRYFIGWLGRRRHG